MDREALREEIRALVRESYEMVEELELRRAWGQDEDTEGEE
jgi:hypothetical protein